MAHIQPSGVFWVWWSALPVNYSLAESGHVCLKALLLDTNIHKTGITKKEKSRLTSAKTHRPTSNQCATLRGLVSEGGRSRADPDQNPDLQPFYSVWQWFCWFPVNCSASRLYVALIMPHTGARTTSRARTGALPHCVSVCAAVGCRSALITSSGVV